jgi:hypothetical protein
MAHILFKVNNVLRGQKKGQALDPTLGYALIHVTTFQTSAIYIYIYIRHQLYNIYATIVVVCLPF